MSSDFSRTLALLRREKKISQRTAAGDLGVSQALLSHYENGLREPGLAFVVKAADYYGVSCDFLLGRSMARDGSAVPVDRMDAGGASEGGGNKVVGAVSLLIDLAAKTGSMQLCKEVETYISLVVYKAYRYIYMADPSGVEAVFRAKREQFEYLCDAKIKEQELRIRTAAKGEEGFGISKEGLRYGMTSPNDIQGLYPEKAGMFLTVLQEVSDMIETLGKGLKERGV